MAQVFDASDVATQSGKRANAVELSIPQRTYDERFTLRDRGGRVLCDTYYTVRLPSGKLIHGVTDSLGRTERYATDEAQRLTLYLGHREV
jgi:hypothetical protein